LIFPCGKNKNKRENNLLLQLGIYATTKISTTTDNNNTTRALLEKIRKKDLLPFKPFSHAEL
jgi:hypothetical protein